MDLHAIEPVGSSPTESGAGRREAVRESVYFVAQLSVDHLPAEQVRVRNLSAGGLMAEFPSPVKRDTPVMITLRGIGEIGGRIAWATDGRIGVAFDRAIDPALVRSAAPSF